MIPVAYVPVFLAIGLFIGLTLGLYLGERGRRIDAQHREVYGHPLKKPARAIPQPPDPEDRARDMGFDPATVERGKDNLRAMYRAAGRAVPNDEELERQAYMMLHHPEGLTDEPA